MKVTIGVSDRWGRRHEHAPVHLVVDVADRQVLVCTGGAPARLRTIALEDAYKELGCATCRTFGRRMSKVPKV